MDNETLNTALYEKMCAEQNAYRSWLLTQPPEEILNHAYKYAVRQDILAVMEELELPSLNMNVLLSSHSVLNKIYRAFADTETDHMDVLRDCIEKQVGITL